MSLITKNNFSIMVVDDEEHIVEFLKMGLEAEGFTVYTAFNGNDAVIYSRKLNPNLIILDVMLPYMNGYEVCSLIKKASNIPIIMLTAKDEIDDKVLGLNLGADDYMIKPFSFKELLARINARLRNSFSETLNKVVIGPFLIKDSAHEIIYKDDILSLSPTEYNLLKYLLLNNGIALSKDQILEKVWGYDFTGEKNIVEVYIRYLRDKISDKNHTIIRTVRGVGYKVVI
ncbi:DNA-binding response OmpR family regulator [Clostridium acetobutylicum]|uniref:Stage 0 sporulation protein A homolog n=1 Tax=Clostridium acetobutylicum (strain ATCC 824 / DSM 792 / JCM 1419 / IAM 19013 / LMG 5710 / NBRC 13948 / NRRL B-527 / VKM B-1787 / 2291 / W) TaxID=272562 RepID=Q97FH9_CLOAB|nr:MULTISPECIES: response regulator transcription factor [Clostridium]AAK80704.1 Response regulator (CheY receiver domain and HTH-type DNA-binding domain) [Clostridium acetobutylicum ATCC 824]ADZ21805.1 Response regulator (CheY receiver domain and HTH-type DNA-binding domain) [Clostridium acetobutylicum EA 2018]AEI34741.1 response regulator [Clostridium acetobutylicum DSM 1731]AWV78882.1 DNA-binding response regulator [Clostridium acetobutylicum]MBC2395119.1 response regulator transcription fa